MTRVYSEDLYYLGLLYTYLCNKNIKMVKLDNLKEFCLMIKSNLDKIESEAFDVYATLRYDDNNKMYFIRSNEKKEIYFFLEEPFNLKRLINIYNCLSSDVIKASQMNNSLECLKLNKKIIKKKLKKIK